MNPEQQAPRKMPAWLGETLGWIGGLLVCLLPAGLLLIGLSSLLFGSLRLTWGSALLFLLGPGLILARLIWVLAGKRSPGSKCLRALGLTALLAVLVLSTSFWTFFLPLEFHDVSHFRAAERFAKQYPHLELIQDLPLGSPEETVFHDCQRLQGLFFETQACALVCRYGSDYEAQKAALEAQLPFRAEPLESGDPDTGERLRFDPAVLIGDDLFRFLEPGENYQIWFEKFSVLFVTNDAARELAFLIYDDIEVDSVTDIEEFIEHDCCWAMIR